MNDRHSFEYWQELIAGFVLGDLEPAETTELHRLLAEHPELVTDITELQEVLRRVVDDGVGVEPPPHLGWHILQAIEAEDRLSARSKIFPLTAVFRHSQTIWYLLWGSLIAALIGGLGWHDYQLQQALSRSEKLVGMLQAPHTRIFQFRGMPVAKNASGSLMVNLASNRAALALRDLPVKNGKFYRLWAIVDRDRKLGCGHPLHAEAKAIANEFGISPQQYSELYHPHLKGFVVTMEDSPTTTQPSGPIVMSSI
jgi:Anti-sigma-K factor rskA